MTTPRQIPHPDLKSATRLSALDLNKIHFDKRHTVITPELLAKHSAPQTAE